jgi:hypothetical protein
LPIVDDTPILEPGDDFPSQVQFNASDFVSDE